MNQMQLWATGINLTNLTVSIGAAPKEHISQIPPFYEIQTLENWLMGPECGYM